MEAELKKIRKDIRRRNWKIVMTSILLVAAMLVGIVQFAIPALEARYWDPNVFSYSPYCSDLEFTMAAYSELFVPAYNVSRVRPTKTGFASYDLSMICVDNRNSNQFSYFNGNLIQDELTIPAGLWQYAPGGSFHRDDNSYNTSDSSNNNVRKVLQQLPEYVMVRADVSFPEDLSMTKIMEFQDRLFSYSLSIESTINWVAIRSCGEEPSMYPMCGMKPFTILQSIDQSRYGGINESYPSFCIDPTSAFTMEEHFKSLLQYSNDQVRGGTGIIPEYSDLGADYYQNVLDYVEENGIFSYGCTITATPNQLLELLDDGTVSRIVIQDVWIGFYN